MATEATSAARDLLDRLLRDIGGFSRAIWPERALRPYQEEAARAIAASVLGGLGRQFAIVFARQAGKDELLAQLIAYLLDSHRDRGGAIVVAAPTFRPQSLVARSRLLERLDNPLNRQAGLRPAVESGYVVRVGRASARFLSAGPTANVRGETASLLLVCNEAQDVEPDRWDAAFDPMAASTNATTVFSGTVWSDRTLLARQMRHLRELERADGARRVFAVPWTRVAADLPAYGERVRARIAQFGRDHPFIRTEYELLELAGAGGLFAPARRAQLRGDHPRQRRATPGRHYALLIDVAGEDDALADLPDGGAAARGGRRDSTALTVVEILHPSAHSATHCGGYPGTPHSALPSYRVVDRRLWTGARHTALHAAIVDLARVVWRARRVIVDATGIGAGLASWLAAALPGLVLPWVATAQAKSDLGWRLLAAIDGGRLKEYADDGADDTRLFWRQLEACGYEVRPGPGKLLAWGVDDARTHDDLLLSLALVGLLDDEDLRPRVARGLAPGRGGLSDRRSRPPERRRARARAARRRRGAMVTIRESLIPAGNSNRPGLALDGGGPRFITIHETANPSPGADAEMHRRFAHGAGGWGGGGHPANASGPAYEGVSFHYAVDDREAVRLLPDDEVAWHAGDGAHGPGNRRSVAIELCVNADGDAERARRHLIELVALLLRRHALPLANVRMHRDWSGKNCPANIIGTGAWPGLIAAIGALAGAAPASAEAAALRRWAEAAVPFAARGDLVREGTVDLREFGGRRDEWLALYQRLVAHRLNGANYVMTLDLWDRLRGEGKVALAR